MELTLSGIQDRGPWEAAGIALPGYDVRAVSELGRREPVWAHFGIGNIFRVFIGSIADELLECGAMDRGLICLENFDAEIVDKIYAPFDNLALKVILRKDGGKDMKVLGSLAQALRSMPAYREERERVMNVFARPSLQMVSFTVTEKGYSLKAQTGEWLPQVGRDLKNPPKDAESMIGVLTFLLFYRYMHGAFPLALVSMDNCAHNGKLLKESVLTVAAEWQKNGFVPHSFLDYLSDGERISFPCTMIDKITPRPLPEVEKELTAFGIEHMGTVITAKRSYIAPFVNAEKAQYLVIEDRFPNGRPPLEKASGVWLTDAETVEKAERMKVSACLNPVHSALGPLGVACGYEYFADLMGEADFLNFGKTITYLEGMPVIEDPGILSPKSFADELFEERFLNRTLGDTNLRLCTDVTQGWSVRFGEMVKACAERDGSAASLTGAALGIAGCLRYFSGRDDRGSEYELAPDPLAERLHALLKFEEWGVSETVLSEKLRPILSNRSLFGTDLYQAGIGKRIEQMLAEMLTAPGAARAAVRKYFAPR